MLDFEITKQSKAQKLREIADHLIKLSPRKKKRGLSSQQEGRVETSTCCCSGWRETYAEIRRPIYHQDPGWGKA